MKVNLVGMFKPVKKVAYCDKYGNHFVEKSNSRVHISQDMDRRVYTRLDLLRDDLERLSNLTGYDFLFVKHKNSDTYLMNHGPYTSAFSLETSMTDIENIIQEHVNRV